ncbi:MAG: hypothetical protein FWH21_06605 [Kiritimatiellaeota bacterium]|nr:hypothetical protein [Kiritimatiellota bacterium]
MQNQSVINKGTPARKYPWLWDTDMGNARFDEYLTQAEMSSYDARWAMLRLIDYAPYRDLQRMLPIQRFLTMWPQISTKIRPRELREGMDFVHQWITQNGGADD